MPTAIQSIATDLRSHFAELEDPREGNALLHRLDEILIIAICAIICGANCWSEVEAFGRAKEAWLRTFLVLEHGIPSHDTFGRVFRHLNPAVFESCFCHWTHAIWERLAGEVIPVDGKCLRGSHDAGSGKQAIYIVSAWANANRLVLGQRKVAEKSNEITAIPELLRTLDVAGCIVSIDAMGTQKTIAQQIVTQGGEYMLALKENQPHLLEDVQSLFLWADKIAYEDLRHAYTQTVNKGHGRIETRECWTISDPAGLALLADRAAWANLRTVVRIRARRQVGEQCTVEERFYISSMEDVGARTATRALDATRSHWGIENRLHWILDVAFREDECRVRKDHGDENLAVLRHISLNILQRDTTTRIGVHGKRLKAAWDTDYLEKLLRLSNA